MDVFGRYCGVWTLITPHMVWCCRFYGFDELYWFVEIFDHPPSQNFGTAGESNVLFSARWNIFGCEPTSPEHYEGQEGVKHAKVSWLMKLFLNHPTSRGYEGQAEVTEKTESCLADAAKFLPANDAK